MTSQIVKSETKINNILFWLCFLISILAVAMTLLEFFSRDEYPPTSISLFYVGVLAIYSLHKEAIRFLEYATPERKSIRRRAVSLLVLSRLSTTVRLERR